MKLSDWLKMRVGLFQHPQFYTNPIAAIRRRLLWKFYGQHQFTLKFMTEYGFQVIAQPQDIGVGSLFYRGQYEWAELQLWRRLLNRPNLTILDVGANIGLYSLVTAAYCRQQSLIGATIFGFEPNPLEFAKFQQNVDLNGYSEIQAFNIAVSGQEGVSQMAIPPNGLGVFGHLLSPHEKVSSQDTITEVKTVNLDNWCKSRDITQIDLMKLDVEGYELEVLKGAENLLSQQSIGVLFMEIGHGLWRESLSLLQDHRYSINLIRRDGSIQPFDDEFLTGWDNIIAQPIC